MSNRRKIGILLLVILGLVLVGNLASRSVFEQSTADRSNIIFVQDYSLSNTVNSPLVVIADHVNLNGDSQVNGDAALVGRTAVTLGGQVNGDLSAMGNDVHLEKNAHISGDTALMGNQVVLDGQIDGDLTVISDTLTINPGAQVNGDITACVTHLGDERSGAASISPCSQAQSAKFTALQSLRDGNFSFGGLNMASSGLPVNDWPFSLALSLALTGLSVLAVTVFPRPFSYLVEAVQTMPRRMAGMGCLTTLFALGGGVILLVVLADVPVLGLLLLPFGALLGLLLLGMVVTGWMTLALVLGTWLAKRVGSRGVPPLLAVAVGSVLLFVLWHVLALLPFGGVVSFVLMVVLGTIGLGAAFTTRLGTRPLRRSYFVQG